MDDLLKQLSWLPQPFAFTTCINDKRFLELAYAHGNATSPDPSTKNGAVLVGLDNKIIAYSTNKFPKDVAETQTRLNDRPTKYRMVVHAENGAVFNAARHGRSTNNTTLYCPFYSCSECAKAIIQSGIKKIVGHAQLMAIASDHREWVKTIIHGWEMMQEAGVECILFDGVFGIITKFNYKDIAI